MITSKKDSTPPKAEPKSLQARIEELEGHLSKLDEYCDLHGTRLCDLEDAAAALRKTCDQQQREILMLHKALAKMTHLPSLETLKPAEPVAPAPEAP